MSFISFLFLQELLKSTVDLADLVGIHFVMSKIAGKGQLKFMIAGLGWATAELVMTRCPILHCLHAVQSVFLAGWGQVDKRELTVAKFQIPL